MPHVRDEQTIQVRTMLADCPPVIPSEFYHPAEELPISCICWCMQYQHCEFKANLSSQNPGLKTKTQVIATIVNQCHASYYKAVQLNLKLLLHQKPSHTRSIVIQLRWRSHWSVSRPREDYCKKKTKPNNVHTIVTGLTIYQVAFGGGLEKRGPIHLDWTAPGLPPWFYFQSLLAISAALGRPPANEKQRGQAHELSFPRLLPLSCTPEVYLAASRACTQLSRAPFRQRQSAGPSFPAQPPAVPAFPKAPGEPNRLCWHDDNPHVVTGP